MGLPRFSPRRPMLAPTTFAGDVALIAGPDTPLGKALAHGLAACGARVTAAGADEGGAALDEAEARLGPVTVLVDTSLFAPVSFGPAEELETLDASPMTGLFGWARALTRRRMADGRGAAILSVGRSLANKGGLGLIRLAANQAAVEAQTKAFAAEWARFGVRANLLLAGLIEDDAFPSPLPAGVAREALAPSARLADPHEIVWPALYLLSRYAAYVTGATFVVDGGYSIKRSNSGPDYDPEGVFTGKG